MKATLYPREFYLRQIRAFYESDLIKVITGIRRCGKSSLLLSIIAELRTKGVPEKDIIYLNLDAYGFGGVKSVEKLDALIAENCFRDKDQKYVFIDEIQNVKDFEPYINSLREEGNISIFITGSNSYLLSGELATKLTGRHVEFNMFTLSYQEFCAMKKFKGQSINEIPQLEFESYLREGGFPQTLALPDAAARHQYVKNLLDQILKKDVRSRFKIRNTTAFSKVLMYVVGNFGAPINLKSLAQYLADTEGLRIKPFTLGKYIDYLKKARIVYPCARFDLKSRKALQDLGKYYLADTSLYFAIQNDARIAYGPILENLLYVYLTARGYQLSVGKMGKLECDFIARKDNDYYYLQVAMTIAERATEDREYRVLEAIPDNYPKYLFTLDPLLQHRKGIIHRNLLDFIQKGEELNGMNSPFRTTSSAPAGR